MLLERFTSTFFEKTCCETLFFREVLKLKVRPRYNSHIRIGPPERFKTDYTSFLNISLVKPERGTCGLNNFKKNFEA